MTSKLGRAAEATSLDPQRLFHRLAGRRGIVLAVSGGADSTALMILMAEWHDRPAVTVACVDHRLRPEAAAEAEMVVENAGRLGLPAQALTVPQCHSGGNVQDWARRARYRCLAEFAHELSYDAIVTAHHRDDQAETFLLRLARGSGVYGLAAMAEMSKTHGVDLVRPLLDVPGQRLRDIAEASGLPTVADPSNDDRRFDRVRLRSLMPQLARYGLTAERLAGTATRLGRAKAALDFCTAGFLRDQFAVDSFGVLRGPAAAFDLIPDEVGLRALALILKAIGGASYTPELESVEALHSALRDAASGTGVTRTLHGVVISARDSRVIAYREWGRDGLAEAEIAAGATVDWDHRFRVVAPQLDGQLSAAALGRSKRRLRASGATQATLRVLPGLYQNGTLVAVPPGVSPADDGPPLQNLDATCLIGAELGLQASPR